MTIAQSALQGYQVEIGGGAAYRKLRASQQGLYYWDLGSQQIILEELEEYLPQVTEVAGCGIFSKVVNGREICSQSEPIGQHKLPAEVISGLERAVARLQAHLSAPGLTPEARLLISNFKLPDPARLPEFYRRYRHAGRTCVFVIWGCDRSNIDSIAPLEAIAKLPREGWLARFWRIAKLPLAILALLALIALIVGLIMAWPRAELVLSKHTIVPGESLTADVSGSKGERGVLTWTGQVAPQFDSDWNSAGDLALATTSSRNLRPKETARPVTLQFNEPGSHTIAYSVGNHYLGIPLPDSTARHQVHVEAPGTRRSPDETGPGSPPDVGARSKHLTVHVASPKGLYPAVVEAVSDKAGTIDFTGRNPIPCQPGQPVQYKGFTKPGVYRVDFAPDGAPGEKDPAYLRLDPPAGVPIVANLRLSKDHGIPGEKVYADSSSSFHTEPDGQIMDRQISEDGGKTFRPMTGDGEVISLPRPGNVDVVLRLKDNHGRVADDRGSVKVETPKPFTPENIDEAMRTGGDLSIPEGVLFASGSATLSTKGQTLLRGFARTVAAEAGRIEKIRIIGHTDNVPVRPGGSFGDNMQLSVARAEAAAAAIRSAGVDLATSLETAGAADREPLAPNTTSQNQERNRRIQIKVELKK